jgi:hypothetical protein
MSIRKENNGNDMGEPSKIAANHGTIVSTPSGPFKNGISQLPELNGSNSYPKQGRINTGKDKLDVVP